MANATYPPGPSAEPLGIGPLRGIQRDFLGFARRLQAEYGDCVSYRLAGMRIFQFTHPEQYYEVLVEQQRAFHKTGRLRAVLGRWNGRGLLLNEDDGWARQKRLVQPAFRPQRMDGYAESIVRHTRELFEPCAGKDVNVADVLHRLTFRCVAEALFGAEVDSIADDFLAAVATLQREAIGDFTAVWIRPLWWPTRGRRELRGAMKFLDEVVRGFISKRRASGEDRGDLLSMLLLAVDEEGGTGQMTDEQVRDEAVGLLLGGNETMATALVWTAYLLATHEALQEETYGEIQHVTGGHPPTAEHVPRLGLATAAMKEAMRLYPPAYVLTREAVKEVEISGYTIKPGNQVHLPLAITQRDGRWFDREDDFVPHRFLNDGETTFPRGAYAPFGLGPRACIGRGLALLEGTLILATLLGRYTLRLAAGQGEPEEEAQISLHPRGGVRLHLSPR